MSTTLEIILGISILIAVSLAVGRLAKLVHLPNVTAYLVAGLLVGPSCFKFLSHDVIESFSILTTVALGFIAFSIGGEFKIQNIKRIGGKVITITFFQALMTVLFVDIGLLILAAFGLTSVPEAIVLGAIATATAPAATLMVVKQYKAKGPVTEALLPVVALDDAIGLMVFAISNSIAMAIHSDAGISVKTILIDPLLEIVLSLGVGLVIGVILAVVIRFFHSRSNKLCLMIVSVFSGVGASIAFDELLGIPLSSLLVCMMIGAAFCNLKDDAVTIMEGSERWTPPLFLLFFAISGAELNLATVLSVGVVGIVYLATRSAGKWFGAFLGATVTKADTNIRKYLGVALLPQAGVAIGMSQIVAASFPDIASTVTTVVLCATLIYELFGPVLTKIALQKAGEIVKPEKKKKQPETK